MTHVQGKRDYVRVACYHIYVIGQLCIRNCSEVWDCKQAEPTILIIFGLLGKVEIAHNKDVRS